MSHINWKPTGISPWRMCQSQGKGWGRAHRKFIDLSSLNFGPHNTFYPMTFSTLFNTCLDMRNMIIMIQSFLWHFKFLRNHDMRLPVLGAPSVCWCRRKKERKDTWNVLIHVVVLWSEVCKQRRRWSRQIRARSRKCWLSNVLNSCADHKITFFHCVGRTQIQGDSKRFGIQNNTISPAWWRSFRLSRTAIRQNLFLFASSMA